jgi:uncharacterized protein YndB with AHSA1/START domain
MVHAEYEVVIDRPIAEVFAFLADGLNDPTWRDGVEEIHRTSEAIGIGATYRQMVRGPGGIHAPGDYVISEYDPPHRLGFQVTAGPVRPTGRFDLTETDPARTTVRSTIDVNPTGAMRFMAGIIGKEFENEVRQIERLKDVLEQ